MGGRQARTVATPGTLYREIHAVLAAARSSAYRAVNTAMVQAYWQVGKLIVEHEQGGRRRAAYGESLLEDLSRRLTTDFGRGFTITNLRYMRQFFLAFPIHHAVRDESDSTATTAGRRAGQPATSPIRHALRDGFAAKYVKVLPSEAELEREIERERRLIDMRRSAREDR